jgi:hypothetical protein
MVRAVVGRIAVRVVDRQSRQDRGAAGAPAKNRPLAWAASVAVDGARSVPEAVGARGGENRDLRQLLWHRHRLVQRRSRVKKQLQAIALNQGMQRKSRLREQSGTSTTGVMGRWLPGGRGGGKICCNCSISSRRRSPNSRRPSSGSRAGGWKCGDSMWLLPLACTATKTKRPAVPAFALDPQIETYFLGAIASLAALATRNFTTVLALI